MQLQQNLKLLLKLILIILLQNVNFIKTEFYSSIHEMTKLVEYEDVFLQHMQKFIAANEDKLDFLKARLAEFERERDEAIVGGPTYFDSPVNQYMLTKSLTIDWERLENLMQTKTGKKTLEKLQLYKSEKTLPNEDEVNGAAAGLLRLQDIYRLRSKDIAAGLIQGVQYDTELDARHCFDIGTHGVELEKYRLAHSWLMEALERMPEDGPVDDIDTTFERAHILAALADAKTKLGDIRGANETYTELLELKPDSQTLAQTYMVFMLEHGDKNSTEIDYSEEHAPIPANLYTTEQNDRYKYTCSGHINRTAADDRYLRCGYLTETHPFLQLAPIKVEELNHDPLVVLYHEVLSDKEIEAMRELANYRVQRATVMGVNASIVSPVRTSQFVFLPKSQHKILQTIDRRAQDMTNLDMNYAEDHQFQNYGIGGHYGQHHDYFHKEAMDTVGRISGREMGNRIATVLFYLTDVEQGGGTAFPYLRRLLMPKKGSAAFWHNLHASGDPDERTLHGGCPIIAGSKWVLNRWIREGNQDKTRPCEVFNDFVPGPF